MRIVIDARELHGHTTGVGRYLSGLLTAWGSSGDARRHHWTLVSHAPIQMSSGWNASTTIVPGNGGTAWEQFTLPRAVGRERPDVFFAPGYTAPLTVAAPLVLTIHDVSFFAHPEWFSFREGQRRRMLSAWSARRARTVITISDFSKAEIRRHIGIAEARVRVIPLGIQAPTDRPSNSSQQRAATVLYVGSIFERRRVDRLIASFDDVARRVPGARLEIVGENRTREPRLDLEALRRRSPHADRINIRSYVDEDTLAQLYREASVFVFLSEYEGFGFTPLEALREGVPPVVLDTAIAREACGGAARYIAADAGNQQISDAIVELLSSPAARAEVLDEGARVLARYDWTRTAADTLAVLEEAAVGR